MPLSTGPVTATAVLRLRLLRLRRRLLLRRLLHDDGHGLGDARCHLVSGLEARELDLGADFDFLRLAAVLGGEGDRSPFGIDRLDLPSHALGGRDEHAGLAALWRADEVAGAALLA